MAAKIKGEPIARWTLRERGTNVFRFALVKIDGIGEQKAEKAVILAYEEELLGPKKQLSEWLGENMLGLIPAQVMNHIRELDPNMQVFWLERDRYSKVSCFIPSLDRFDFSPNKDELSAIEGLLLELSQNEGAWFAQS